MGRRDFLAESDGRRRRARSEKILHHGVFDAAFRKINAFDAFGPDLVRKVVFRDVIKTEALKKARADREREEAADMLSLWTLA